MRREEQCSNLLVFNISLDTSTTTLAGLALQEELESFWQVGRARREVVKEEEEEEYGGGGGGAGRVAPRRLVLAKKV